MQRQHIRMAAALLPSLLAFLMAACSSSQPAAPPANEKAAEPAHEPLTPTERAIWYQGCWSLFNEHNWAEFKKCYADNAVSEQMGYGPPSLTGPDAIVASSEQFAKSFPDATGEAQLILVNGPHVAGIYLLKGMNSGPLTAPDGKEAPATNKKFGLLFGHAIDADETAPKVVKEWGVMDGATLNAQLGLSKAPARPVPSAGAPMPTIVIANNGDTEMKNIEAEKAQLEAWNNHDAKGVAMYISDKSVMHEQPAPRDMNKAQNMAESVDFWKGFSDVKLTTSSMWAAGDYVAIIGRLDGTNDGDFAPMNLKKTGKKASLPFLEIDRLEGGKLIEGWLFFDGLLFGSQMGL